MKCHYVFNVRAFCTISKLLCLVNKMMKNIYGGEQLGMNGHEASISDFVGQYLHL